jgi:type I restriction enzyme S subunit
MEKILPKSWIESNIEEVTYILDSKRKPVSAKVRSTRMGNIPYYGATGQTGWIDDFIFDDELVLLGEDGAPFFDKTKNVAYSVEGKSWVNNHAHVLKAKSYATSNNFLLHYLNQFDYNGFVGGTTRLKLNQGNLKQIPFPLPPLAEQKRIVERLDTLFGHLERLEGLLAEVPQLVKDFRQSVLTQAVTGGLTEEWRVGKEISKEELLEKLEVERISYYDNLMDRWKTDILIWKNREQKLDKPKKPKLKKSFNQIKEFELKGLLELPHNWEYVKQGELIEEPKYGTSKKCSYEERGLGVLRIPNIKNGEIDSLDLKYAEFTEDEIKTYGLKVDDILTIRSNGSVDLVGKNAVITSKYTNLLYAGYLIRLRPISSVINSKYLHFALSSFILRLQIESSAKSTSGVNNINSKELENLIIPYCPLSEQTEIVRQVEHLFQIADKIEAQYEVLKAKIEVLPQAILAKAFRGELVEQLDTDGDARELLKAIKEMKEVMDVKKKGRKK